jgi:hypothetical protein
MCVEANRAGGRCVYMYIKYLCLYVYIYMCVCVCVCVCVSMYVWTACVLKLIELGAGVFICI